MTETKALEILKKYTTRPNLIKHALAVAAVMKHFARLEGENSEYWASVGILHDADYELYPDEHCKKLVEILKEEGFDEKFIHAIESHGYELCTDIEPKLYMESVLYTIDQLTGLIIACALIRPEKKLEPIDLETVKKKWNTKGFAAGTNRERILRGVGRMGKSFDYVIEQTLIAMKSIAGKLGL